MAQITISDLTGSAQIDVSDASLASKNQLSSLTTASAEVVSALPKPVTDPTFQDAALAAVFEKPSIPLEGNTVDVKASVNSTLSVYRTSDSPLFGTDDYDPIEIKGNECWVAFELDTLLDATLGTPLPDGFGVSFEASTAPSFATYILIPADQTPRTTLQQAIEKVLDTFNVLDSSQDVLSISQGVIYTSDVAGTVKVGGSWTLPLAVNQLSLADADLPFNSSISVNPALQVSFNGDIGVTSEFTVRFRRVAPGKLRVGLYKKGDKTFDVSFTAAAGLAANSGNADLISEFFTAVAPGINVTRKLRPEDAAKIQKVLNDSLDRSLSTSLRAAWSIAPSDSAAIAYEIDVSAMDRATKDAIDSVLIGDWTGVTRLPNARKIRNVITDAVETRFRLTVNILGLYNYRSVNDFVKAMRVITNPEDASVVITDSATATLITTASTPLAADPDRLRAVLYESFLATAAYKALSSRARMNATFGATQAFLLYKDSMGYRDALKQLNTGEVLGVMPNAIKTGLPAAGAALHHALFVASCNYGDDDVMRFFFSDIDALTPRTSDELKNIARTVLARLLDPQDPTDQKRIAALRSDGEWAKMDANPAQILPPFYSDWYDITEWAPAIAKVGPLLKDAIVYFAKAVKGDPGADPTFMKKRQNLARAIDGAIHKTKAASNQNFPICVMATLAGVTPGVHPPIFGAAWNGKTLFTNESAPLVAAAAQAPR